MVLDSGMRSKCLENMGQRTLAASEIRRFSA